MDVEILQIQGNKIAILKSKDALIKDVQDTLDLLANVGVHDCHKIILRENNLAPAFFDLRSGLAGEVLQKFSTYNIQLAIIGDFSKYTSKSLQDFILESNQYGHIIFVNSLEEAKEKLSNDRRRYSRRNSH